VETMKALVYYGPGDMRLDTRPIPSPARGEVLVKVRAVSVCGSDLGAYRLPGVSARWQPPIVLGHEFSGEIVKLGEDVRDLKVGQPVTANPILYCGSCYYCKHGQINLCPNRYSLGTSIGGITHDGAMQEYLSVRASAIYSLLDGVSFAQGALIEPLAVSLSAAKLGDFGEGERAAIIGAGPIGLMILKFIKAAGNKKVFVSDILVSRLDFAKTIGADAVIDGRGDVVSSIADLTENVGVDRVLIAAGAPGIVEKSLQMVRNGGKIVLVALIHHDVQLDLMPIVTRQISLSGSYMYTQEFSEVLASVAQKKVIVDDLITSVIPLRESKSVFQDLCKPDCKDIKVILTND
jgi:threonine dehydrogenase-like Zn-dependent dehydrogenase